MQFFTLKRRTVNRFPNYCSEVFFLKNSSRCYKKNKSVNNINLQDYGSIRRNKICSCTKKLIPNTSPSMSQYFRESCANPKEDLTF